MEVIYKYQDIKISRTATQLILENSRIRRVMDCSHHGLRTISLTNAGNVEFAAPEKPESDFSFMGLGWTPETAANWQPLVIKCRRQKGSWRDGDAVKITLTLVNSLSDILFKRTYFLYPKLPIIAVENSIRSAVTPNFYWPRRTERFVNAQEVQNYPPSQTESCVDNFQLNPQLKADYTVQFQGRTDYTDDLVQHFPIQSDFAHGNLLFCHFKEQESGLFLLQEAPPSGERRDWETYDFRLEQGKVFSCNWGVPPEEFQVNHEYHSYRHVIGLFASSLDQELVLKNYLRIRYPFDFQRQSSIMVNPWGCGHFPEVATPDFLREDIAAAAKVGATHYQIDDGWQCGDGLKELTLDNRHMTPDFWEISPRLKPQFADLMRHAKQCGIAPALWFAPSSNCDYADWRESAQIILNFYRNYGIKIFKIDAIKIRTVRAEQNLRHLLSYVRQQSHGEVSFNLDTTNGQRPGYFYFLEFGNIFLENRYVCHLWGVGYHPEKLLHSLWNLSRYINTYMLQIEIPDLSKINAEFYQNYPLGRPDAYPVDYIAMLAMFASPLLWFTPSTLPGADLEIIKKVLQLHRQYRDEIAQGTVCPVGAEPDGQALSGFHAINPAKGSGFLLFFREKGCQNSQSTMALPGLPPAAKFHLLAGSGNLQRRNATEFDVTVSNCPGYLLYRYA